MSISPRLLQTIDGFEIATHPAIKVSSFRAIMERDTWYDPEVPFIRRLARPNLRFLDIDADIGFYSLLLAKFSGPEAQIYTIFSPEPSTCARLGGLSIEANGFGQIKTINIDNAAEMYPGYRYDHLDSFRAEAFNNLDLVRIGLPASCLITTNSAQFLQQQSPLLMLEIGSPADGETMARHLEPLGYRLLRHVPGLNALKPARGDEINFHDAHVFFCKDDQFNDLVMRGLAFIPGNHARPPALPDVFVQNINSFAETANLGWLEKLAKIAPTPATEAYFRACSAYLMALDFPLSLSERYACLEDAFQTLSVSETAEAAFPERLSLFLVELAMGQVDRAVRLLESIHFSSPAHLEQNLALPFLLDRQIASRISAEPMASWVQAYLIESYETHRLLPSSLEDDNSNRMTLLTAKTLQGLLSAPLLAAEKRRILAAGRLGLPHAGLPASLVESDFLNAAAWRDLAADNGQIHYFHSVYERDVIDNVSNQDNPLTRAFSRCAAVGIDCKTYLDIGAADAMAAIVHYRSGLFRNMKIVNVEPNNVYDETLAKISAATGGMHLPFAVSDYDGEAQFQESGHEYWSSLRPADDPYWKDYRHIEIKTRPVPVKTVATIVKDYELEGPIFLKMDVQGAEEAVLRGMEPVADQVAFVIVETIAIDLTQINNVLDRLGFTLFDITGIQYYTTGILGWFYPYYINKKYLSLFHNDASNEVDESLIKMQVDRRAANKLWLEDELRLLAQEKMLSDP